MNRSEQRFFVEIIRSYLDKVGIHDVFPSLPVHTLNREFPVHSRTRLNFALSGCISHQLHDGRKDIFPGQIVFALPGSFNSHGHVDRNGEAMSLVFFRNYIRFVYAECFSSGAHTNIHTYHTVGGGICPAGYHLQCALCELMKNPVLDSAAVCGMTESLMRIALDQLEKDTPGKASRSLAVYQNILEYICQHFQQELTRETVAEEFHLTPTHVSRLFHMFGNRNFNNSLRRIRLEYAEDLLRNGNLSIEEVADQSGFSSACYFIQVFRSVHGISPGTYRNQADQL